MSRSRWLWRWMELDSDAVHGEYRPGHRSAVCVGKQADQIELRFSGAKRCGSPDCFPETHGTRAFYLRVSWEISKLLSRSGIERRLVAVLVGRMDVPPTAATALWENQTAFADTQNSSAPRHGAATVMRPLKYAVDYLKGTESSGTRLPAPGRIEPARAARIRCAADSDEANERFFGITRSKYGRERDVKDQDCQTPS